MKRLSEDDIQWLTERLAELGFSKPNMFEYLEGCIGMDVIPYYQRQRFGDDHMSWQLRIKLDKDTGMYLPEHYNALLVTTHPIKHGQFEGIDTAHLEAQLKSINWSEYKRPPIELENMTTRTVDEVLKLQKSKNKDVQDIARRLQVRYWLDTPVEQHIGVAQHVYRYEKRMGISLHNTLNDITAKEAYNLLCGRGIVKFNQHPLYPNSFYGQWKQLAGGQLKEFQDFDITGMLKSLNIQGYENDQIGLQIIQDLIKGDLSPVHLSGDDKNQLFYVSADPKSQSLLLFDQHLNKVNLDTTLVAKTKSTPFRQNNRPVLRVRQNRKGRGKGPSV